jgi:hypothetical protein
VSGRHRREPGAAGRHRHGVHRAAARRGHVVLPTLAVAALAGVGGLGASAALSTAPDHPATRLARVIDTPVPLPLPFGSVPRPAPAVVPARQPAHPSAQPSTTVLPDFALRVTGSVAWVRVVSGGGHVLYEGMLRAGRSLTFATRPLVVTVGNGGAVRLVLHHRLQAAAAGRSGQIVRFTYR